jgi:hypothetical protein
MTDFKTGSNTGDLDANMDIMNRMFQEKETIRVNGIRKRQLEAKKIIEIQESGNTLNFLLEHLIKQNDYRSMSILLGQPDIEIGKKILYKVDIFNENSNNIISELLNKGAEADSQFISQVIKEMDPKKCSESSAEFNRCIQTLLILLYKDIEIDENIVSQAKDRFYTGKYKWVINIFEMCNSNEYRFRPKGKQFLILKENFEELANSI